MKTAGIAIYSWKLPIFKKHLDAAGYSYTQHLGVTSDTMLLKLQIDRIVELEPILEAAQTECREQ
jgi:hypothetical protein